MPTLALCGAVTIAVGIPTTSQQKKDVGEEEVLPGTMYWLC